MYGTTECFEALESTQMYTLAIRIFFNDQAALKALAKPSWDSKLLRERRNALNIIWLLEVSLPFSESLEKLFGRLGRAKNLMN